MTVKPYSEANRAIGSMAQDWPAKWTGITTFGSLPVCFPASNLASNLVTAML